PEEDELELDELLLEEELLDEELLEELLLEELEELLLEDELELPQSLLLKVIQFRLKPPPFSCTRKVCTPAAMFTGPEVSVIQFCQPPVLPTDSKAICWPSSNSVYEPPPLRLATRAS